MASSASSDPLEISWSTCFARSIFFAGFLAEGFDCQATCQYRALMCMEVKIADFSEDFAEISPELASTNALFLCSSNCLTLRLKSSASARASSVFFRCSKRSLRSVPALRVCEEASPSTIAASAKESARASSSASVVLCKFLSTFLSPFSPFFDLFCGELSAAPSSTAQPSGALRVLPRFCVCVWI